MGSVYQITPALVFIAINLAISKTFCKGLKVILPMLVNVWFFGLLIWTDLSSIQNDSLAEVKAFMITCNIGGKYLFFVSSCSANNERI